MLRPRSRYLLQAVLVAGTWLSLVGAADAATRVMVLPFHAPAAPPAAASLGSGTADSLVTALAVLPEFVVVDRSTTQLLLKEKALEEAGLLDERTAVTLGKTLGVEAVISGRVQVAGDRVRISASFVDISTGQVRKAQQVTGRLDEVFDLQDRLIGGFAAEHGVIPTEIQAQRMSSSIYATRSAEARTYYQQGREAYLRSNRDGYREAVDCYRKALAIDAGCAWARAGLAEALARWAFARAHNGEPSAHLFEEALATARESIRLNPELAEAHRALALTQLKMKLPAREAAERAVELAPNDAEALTILWMSGDWNPDDPLLRRALSLNPRLILAHDVRGYALIQANRPAEAVREFHTVLNLNPDDEFARHHLAEALLALGRTEEGLKAAQESLRRNPAAAASHNLVGLALQRQGRREEAVAAYRTALQLNPELQDARENLRKLGL